MDQSLWAEIAKNGIFAVIAAVVAWTLWKEMRRMSDEAKAREERISAEMKAERERMHAEALAREDRLMTLAEGLTDRFEALAGQYEGLASDVHAIKERMA
jgi:predicted Holliday junction resolvase-like endonuclease